MTASSASARAKELNDIVNQCVEKEFVCESTAELEEIVITEMFALLEAGRYAEARHAKRRLPPSVAPSPVSEGLWDATRAAMTRDHAGVFSSLRRLRETVPREEDRARRVEDASRDRAERSLSRGHKTLDADRAARTLGLPSAEDATRWLIDEKGWSVSPTSSNGKVYLTPPVARTNVVADNDDAASLAILERKLKTFTDMVSFMEKKRFNL